MFLSTQDQLELLTLNAEMESNAIPKVLAIPKSPTVKAVPVKPVKTKIPKVPTLAKTLLQKNIDKLTVKMDKLRATAPQDAEASDYGKRFTDWVQSPVGKKYTQMSDVLDQMQSPSESLAPSQVSKRLVGPSSSIPLSEIYGKGYRG